MNMIKDLRREAMPGAWCRSPAAVAARRIGLTPRKQTYIGLVRLDDRWERRTDFKQTPLLQTGIHAI
jgi:hypothetical protein